ncbi:MAG: metal-dependent hydrolase [Planctomycetota bacterium]
MPLTITYLGHSGFLFDDGHDRGRLCVDPFLTGNPKAKHTPDDIDCDYLAFTHGHADHFNPGGWSIARRCQATCIANFEIGEYLDDQVGLEDCLAGNPGGSVPTDFGHVAFTPAVHSSSYEGTYLGVACGFVIHFERVGRSGVTIYHAGDTALFSDMQMIGELAHPDVALLPAGGRLTMSAKLAGKAAELIAPKLAVPMHWGTFDTHAQEVRDFQPAGIETKVVEPGEAWQIGD